MTRYGRPCIVAVCRMIWHVYVSWSGTLGCRSHTCWMCPQRRVPDVWRCFGICAPFPAATASPAAVNSVHKSNRVLVGSVCSRSTAQLYENRWAPIILDIIRAWECVRCMRNARERYIVCGVSFMFITTTDLCSFPICATFVYNSRTCPHPT